MLDFMYYRLYEMPMYGPQKNIPEITAPAYLGALLSLNIFTIGEACHYLSIGSFLHENPLVGIILLGLSIAVLAFYYRPEKRKTLLAKYAQETKTDRNLGWIVLFVYVALSVISFVSVPFMLAP